MKRKKSAKPQRRAVGKPARPAKRKARPAPKAAARPRPKTPPRPAPKPPKPPPPSGPSIIAPRGRGRQREAIAAESRAFPRMKPQAVPRSGWIRAIRDALGISQSQIAARVGVSRATVQQWERAEARRRITVHSLDQVAAAMGCTVALAIVPKNGTLDDVRRRQARAKAIAIVKKQDAPADPDAAVDLTPAQQRRVDRIVTRLLRGSPRRLWKAL